MGVGCRGMGRNCVKLSYSAGGQNEDGQEGSAHMDIYIMAGQTSAANDL